jgi:hypothetical protein
VPRCSPGKVPHERREHSTMIATDEGRRHCLLTVVPSWRARQARFSSFLVQKLIVPTGIAGVSAWSWSTLTHGR